MHWFRGVKTLFCCVFLMPCLSGWALTTIPPTLPTGFECGFEINVFDAWCGITQESNDYFDWIRKTSDNLDFTDPEPSVDHTTHLVHGHYLYAATGTFLKGETGQLNMPVFARNANPQCLEFFYQIGGDNDRALNVYQWLSTSSMPSSPAWQKTGDTADVWNRGLLTIDPQEDAYTVSFEAISGISVSAFIALDDVKISDDACPLENFTCTFEQDMCAIMQDRTDDMDWFRSKGHTNVIYNAPSVDHTLGTAEGYYIFIEAVYISEGQGARVITPPFRGVSDGSPQACLTFFYHMFGSGVGELNVYVVPIDSERGDSAWMLTGDRGDKWRGAEVDITLGDDFTIVFEAVRGITHIGDIALDDIDFQRGDMCPGHHQPPPDGQQATCDFEEVELCGYQQDQTDDVDWIWQNRASHFVNAGPLYDHTNNDEFGYYLFLYGVVGHRTTARMISPVIPRMTHSHPCLEFWWHLYGNDEQKLSVYCVPGVSDIPETSLLSMSGNYGDYWRRSRLEIPNELTSCSLIFQGTTGIHNRDDIAIDDVNVYFVDSDEQCLQDTYTIEPTTMPPTISNINCDFENTDNTTCGWTQSLRDGFDWILCEGPSPGYSSGPDVDHTKQTNEGHYMLTYLDEELPPNSKAGMISPLISPYTDTRCFGFWYFMNGRNTGFLNIFIVSYGSTWPMDPNVQLYGRKGSEWLEGQMSVPPSTRSFYIIVEGAITDRSFVADIAVDDFTLSIGTCTGSPPPNFPFIANCNFEKGICGYTQPVDDSDDEDEFDWFLNSGSTGTDGSGPTADHTKGTAAGHYLYMEASQPRRPGDRARIISPVINQFNDTYCLEFFYHMSGDDTASLTVIHRGDYYPDQEIARLTGPAEMGWNPYNVDVGIKYGPIEIVFTGIVGNSYRGDIGLDDITLTPGPCGGYPEFVHCNYEYGYHYCQFTQSADDQLDWEWFNVYTGETPPTDWSGYGSFMYVDGSNRTSGDTAVLQTPMMTSRNNDYCFSFDFKLDVGMSLDFVSVSRDGSQKTLKSFTKSSEMTHTEYTIPTTDHPNVYRVHIIATVRDGKRAGLAVVDNTFFTFGSCDYTSASTNSNMTFATILGILLGFALLVLVAMGVLHYRNTLVKPENLTPAILYKNGGTVNQPDLSKDTGFDNPNYKHAP